MTSATARPPSGRPPLRVRLRRVLAPDPRGLPAPLRLEARLVPLRAVGALVVALALPLLGPAAGVGAWAAAVPLASLLYNAGVAWALRRRPACLAGGRTTQACDAVLVAAAATFLEPLVGPGAHLVVLTLVVAAGLRFGLRSVLLVAALYCAFAAVPDLARGHVALGALVVQTGFGVLAGALAALVRREALAGEARHAALFAEAADAILVADAAGRCVDANPAACALLGAARDELLGADVAALTRMDRARLAEAKAVLEGTGRWQGELELRRADGRPVVVEARVSTVVDADGPLRLAVLRDVTERKEAERQRAALAEAEKLRALGQMAGGVAHDLNQSLAMVMGYADSARLCLAQTPPDLEQLGRALDVVTRAAGTGGETVRRLLAFARVGQEAPPEPTDVDAVLREAAELTAPRWRDAAQAEGRQISLHVESRPGLVVEGWPAALRDALTNLVFNAVDALPRGGTIRLAARRAGDEIVVEVEDSGVGMPPEVRARAFEPFFTTKGEKGTGLGLAQVFTAVERHRGRVGVRSAPGAGTTFAMTLPAAAPGVARRPVPPDAAAADPRPPAAAAGAAPAAGGPRLRILAVDDEPLLRELAAEVLRRQGHAVVTAASGEEALERLLGEPFELVVTDLGLGAGMNGWELVEQVRARFPAVRVALATGWGAQIDPAAARARGVERVLAKPYRMADLQRLAEAAAPAP